MPDYYFIKSKLNGNVIDIVNASDQTGAGVDAYPPKSSGTDNQLWEFVSSPFPGYFQIKSKLGGLILQVPESPARPGLPLNVSATDEVSNAAVAPQQLWQFYEDPAGSGYYYIVSKLNGFVIDILEASTKPGALLDLYPPKSADLSNIDNQLWQVEGTKFPSPVKAARAPDLGLGSASNYFLAGANNATLTDLSLRVQVTQEIVGSDGFSFQLNTYSTKSVSAWQQYFISFKPYSSTLYAVANCWHGPPQNSTPFIDPDMVSLVQLPKQTTPLPSQLPAGYALEISLQNDENANITGAQYRVLNDKGSEIGSQSIVLQQQKNLLTGSSVGSDDLAPVVAAQVIFVDWGNSGQTTLSSGAGYMTLSSSTPMIVMSYAPHSLVWPATAGELANSGYGQLPQNQNESFTQTFETAEPSWAQNVL
jgi:hypothetical protein